LTEYFTLTLRSFGEREAVLGSRTVVNITVLGNENPYGVFIFPDEYVAASS